MGLCCGQTLKILSIFGHVNEISVCDVKELFISFWTWSNIFCEQKVSYDYLKIFFLQLRSYVIINHYKIEHKGVFFCLEPKQCSNAVWNLINVLFFYIFRYTFTTEVKCLPLSLIKNVCIRSKTYWLKIKFRWIKPTWWKKSKWRAFYTNNKTSIKINSSLALDATIHYW